MKILIWVGTYLVTGCITTALEMKGIRLGAIPTVILYATAFAIAKLLCIKYDEKHNNKKEDTDYSDDKRMR